ncbi:MAG: SBBP repeat-containing protein, partial [Deltaproteobacteria bacterium]|nr:SBBP repeat-containing protein [Deltaproteobacteria bacterium]
QESLAGQENDVFISKINASGSALVYSTYLGGSNKDWLFSIVVDTEGAAYVTGETPSPDFPTKNPIQGTLRGDYDAFITKINSSGTALIYSTYLGGSGMDGGSDIAVDSEGAAYVAGWTESVGFPTLNPIQGSYAGGSDAFIAKIGDPVEKIRIVSWNILNYPDLNGNPREEYYQKVLEGLSPDILIAQEMTSSFGADEFLNNVMKPISKKYRASKFFDGPDTDNVLFYDKTKVKLLSSRQIYSSFRDISEYSLKKKKNPGKGVKFKIYSVHFTEGLSAGDKAQREDEAITLRTYLDGLPPDDLYLVCGTFNMTSSKEKAFGILTDDLIDNIGRLKDPMNVVGRWHHKKKFKSLHTESTRKAQFGDGASGGLNDRYDMILISYGLDQGESLSYRPGSYVAYGNDGKHFKKDINQPANIAVNSDVADALFEASDHLPVIIDLIPREKSKKTD